MVSSDPRFTYTFHLFFLWLPSPELAVARVAERVRMGGHHVPDDTVCRRYRSGLDNFFTRYMPIADTWHVFDNSRESDPQLIATYDRVTGIFINNQLLWQQIRGEY